ncbi:MAG: hypothetical protein PUE85_08380 [Firmicutes bacterium]|nr:hypothetical protein [Bacillota bacterium]
MAKFIWCEKGQKTKTTIFDQRECPFSLCEFKKTYDFKKDVRSAVIHVFGDVKYRLYVNGKFIGDGPVAAGGDYANIDPMPKQYYNTIKIGAGRLRGSSLEFEAKVFMPPAVMTDYSTGTPCFWLSAEIELDDGEKTSVGTDESWECRINPAYKTAVETDYTIEPEPWKAAVTAEGSWNLVKSPLPELTYELIRPTGQKTLDIPPHSKEALLVSFPMIYAGYVVFDISCSGECFVNIGLSETGSVHGNEYVTTSKPVSYRGLRMQSAGEYWLSVENRSDKAAHIKGIGFVSCHYPVKPADKCGDFSCSDSLLNDIYNLCRHTLKICRQTLHLDSPLHQETLGCTGDYAIESLMNYMTFGDPRLTRLDIVRTADLLRMHDGMMFHTSYSLIWVMMMRDYYLYTGDKSIITECADAVRILLSRFARYGKLLCSAPNYMFIDWIGVDGFTMHHPPRVLGQTALCAFLHGALNAAAYLFNEAGIGGSEYTEAAKLLKADFEEFWDESAGLYCDGHTGKTETNTWLPENAGRIYHSRQSNTLAVLYGLCEGERAVTLMRRVAENDLPDGIGIQPYFMHYVFEALHKVGLFKTYGLELMKLWSDMLDRSRKGLAEGFSSFGGDYSHAWGGTPAYQLPCRLSGLEILEPGMRKIALSPDLCGLESMDIRIPTPHGLISVRARKGLPPAVTLPHGITLEDI